MNYLKIDPCNCTDFIGWSTSIWVSGCDHMCKGCFNKTAWKSSSGDKFIQEVKEHLFDCVNKPYVDNLVLLGGDPLFRSNRKDTKQLCFDFNELFPDKNLIIFTGYTWEEILEDKELLDIVTFCTYVVDGKFVEELKCTDKFYGSSNQRIIDVQESINTGKVVEHEPSS